MIESKLEYFSLHPPSAQDKEIFYDFRNQYGVYRWCRQIDKISKSHHDKYWYLVDGCEDKKFWSIHAQTDLDPISRCIGCAGLTDIDYINRRAEFSLYIGEAHQRKGYGRLALIDLFNKGFNTLNLHLIWGETFDGNHAAKMFESIGMTKEGRRRDFYYRQGKYIGATLYSITRDEWTS